MTKFAIAGCSGRMGHQLIQRLLRHPQAELVGGSVRPGSEFEGQDLATMVGLDAMGVLATSKLAEAFKEAEVIIDFTLPEVAIKSLDFYVTHHKKVILGGTGFNPTQLQAIQKASESIAILQSANMSIGVNLCYQLVELAAAKLQGFDIDIFEAHHRNKVDSPSGTALALGERIAKIKGQPLEKLAELNRHQKKQPRKDNEIGFSSVRVGDILGEHTVYFANETERVEITHRVSSRQAFAQGALLAGLWLSQKAAGLYNMEDVLG